MSELLAMMFKRAVKHRITLRPEQQLAESFRTADGEVSPESIS
jgi:hypothetical protein